MRWDNLFDDLEGQLEQELSAEELDVRAEEERLRLGRLSIRDRILAVHEAEPATSIRVLLANGVGVTVRPVSFGRDWFSADVVDDSTRKAQCIVPIQGIAALALTKGQATASLDIVPGETSQTSLSARLSLSFVLRDLCRRRAAVELQTTLGTDFGTIDRVGRDHLDLAVHEPGEPRRNSSVLQARIIPFAHVLLVTPR